MVSERVMLKNQLMAQGTCSRCGAAVQKALYTKTNVKAWLDAEPDPNGRILLDPFRMTYVILKMPEVERAIERGDPLYVNHHATCPVEAREREQQRRPAVSSFGGAVIDFQTRKRW